MFLVSITYVQKVFTSLSKVGLANVVPANVAGYNAAAVMCGVVVIAPGFSKKGKKPL